MPSGDSQHQVGDANGARITIGGISPGALSGWQPQSPLAIVVDAVSI